MADRRFGAILNAEHLLRRSSSAEALNFDEQHRVEPSHTDHIARHAEHHLKSSLSRWWQRHVYMSTSHQYCRDHFANERTVLGYMRTAQAFAMLGVVIAQLMRLQRSPTPDPSLGFFVISVPLSCACHIMALLTACLGCYRFFEWQSTMARGKATSGGFVITILSTLTCLILLCIFILVTVISIRRDG